MGDLQGKKMDDTCGKTGYRGTVDRGFTVFSFIVYLIFSVTTLLSVVYGEWGYTGYRSLLVL
jgi:hypothetical protein